MGAAATTQEIDRLILRASWICLLVGVIAEGGLMIFYPPLEEKYFFRLVLNGSLPLALVSLWIRYRPHLSVNRYVVSLGLLVVVDSIIYTMEHGQLFYIYLFAQALVVLYRDRALLWIITTLAAFSYVLILLQHPEYLADGRAPGDATDWVVNMLAFIMGAVMYDVVTRQLISHAEQIEELDHMVRWDALTGIANRDAFWEFLQRAMDETQKEPEEKQVALIMIDLDRFKEYNDTQGHLAGDGLLAKFAQVLRDCVRDSDLPCRYGGDEFGIVLPAAGRVEAQMVLERIRRGLEGLSQALAFQVGASAGIAVFPEDGRDTRTLVAVADQAMYHEKRQNRSSA